MSQLAVAPRVADASGGTRPASGTIRRTALVNRLRATWSYPVAAIVAPIGYGKTTLLEQWAARDDRPFVWITPDSAVDGIEALIAGVDAALDAAADAIAEGATVAIFDDVHLLHGEALAAVAPLVRLAGKGSMIVLAGRTEPSIPNLSIPGLRARGELLELGVQDLAFTPREARSVVGSATTEPAIAAVLEETEGWPAAVGLIASSGGCAALQAECLAALSPAQRVLLRRTSILERVDRELCDAVLGYQPGEPELQSVTELGAFLVPLDRRRRWFRCHRLLRTALREELEREEPELLPVLHLRAAGWFEAAGDAERALEHSHAAGDIPRFMRIFCAHALTAHNAGREAAVARWIECIDDADALETFPEVAVLAARLHAHRGQRDASARCLDAAERGLAGSQRAEGAGAASARASLVHAATDSPGPAAMLGAAEGALRHLAADDPWRPYGLLLQAVASLLLGEADRTDDLFERAAHAAEWLGSTETRALALAERALLADTWGEHSKADAYLSQIHAADDRLDGFPSYALVLAASAKGLLRHGRWAEARGALGAAQDLVPGLTEALPWLAVQTRLQLAGAWVMLRDPAAARLLVDEADRILDVHPNLGILCRQRESLAAEIDAMPSAASGKVQLTAAELRLLPLLATHLSFREIGAHFFLSRHTVKTQAISAYRKLGASSRSEAVQRAELLGLIDTTGEAAFSG